MKKYIIIFIMIFLVLSSLALAQTVSQKTPKASAKQLEKTPRAQPTPKAPVVVKESFVEQTTSLIIEPKSISNALCTQTYSGVALTLDSGEQFFLDNNCDDGFSAFFCKEEETTVPFFDVPKSKLVKKEDLRHIGIRNIDDVNVDVYGLVRERSSDLITGQIFHELGEEKDFVAITSKIKDLPVKTKFKTGIIKARIGAKEKGAEQLSQLTPRAPIAGAPTPQTYTPSVSMPRSSTPRYASTPSARPSYTPSYPTYTPPQQITIPSPRIPTQPSIPTPATPAAYGTPTLSAPTNGLPVTQGQLPAVDIKTLCKSTGGTELTIMCKPGAPCPFQCDCPDGLIFDNNLGCVTCPQPVILAKETEQECTNIRGQFIKTYYDPAKQCIKETVCMYLYRLEGIPIAVSSDQKYHFSFEAFTLSSGAARLITLPREGCYTNEILVNNQKATAGQEFRAKSDAELASIVGCAQTTPPRVQPTGTSTGTPIVITKSTTEIVQSKTVDPQSTAAGVFILGVPTVYAGDVCDFGVKFSSDISSLAGQTVRVPGSVKAYGGGYIFDVPKTTLIQAFGLSQYCSTPTAPTNGLSATQAGVAPYNILSFALVNNKVVATILTPDNQYKDVLICSSESYSTYNFIVKDKLTNQQAKPITIEAWFPFGPEAEQTISSRFFCEQYTPPAPTYTPPAPLDPCSKDWKGDVFITGGTYKTYTVTQRYNNQAVYSLYGVTHDLPGAPNNLIVQGIDGVRNFNCPSGQAIVNPSSIPSSIQAGSVQLAMERLKCETNLRCASTGITGGVISPLTSRVTGYQVRELINNVEVGDFKDIVESYKVEKDTLESKERCRKIILEKDMSIDVSNVKEDSSIDITLFSDEFNNYPSKRESFVVDTTTNFGLVFIETDPNSGEFKATLRQDLGDIMFEKKKGFVKKAWDNVVGFFKWII